MKPNPMCTGALILALWLLQAFLHSPAAAGEKHAAQFERNQIIDLLEVYLSRAYTFKGLGNLPDFSALDEIYPSWDGGDPGGARRNWLESRYQFVTVKYRVDSVFLTSAFTAQVKGKKTAASSKRVSFLWWFHRSDKEYSTTNYVAFVFRNTKGEWKIKELTEL